MTTAKQSNPKLAIEPNIVEAVGSTAPPSARVRQDDYLTVIGGLIAAGSGKSHALGNSFPSMHREVTYQQTALDHWITDAELDQLGELRKDNVVEIFWGVIGIFLGSVVPAIERFPKIGNQATPLGMIDLVIVMICGVSFVVTVLMGIAWKKRSAKAEDITTKIRNRKKFSVDADGTHPRA